MSLRDTLLVTGSREWTAPGIMRRHLWMAWKANIRRLVHGGARGADVMAGEIWKGCGGVVDVYHVDEAIDGPWPRAGVKRNERMVANERRRIAQALAFTMPTSRRGGMTAGTADCVARLMQAAIPVTVVPYHPGW